MNANLQQVSDPDLQWQNLKSLVPAYLYSTGPASAADILHLVKEALNDQAIALPEGDDTEELYQDLSTAVDVIEACMAGMELRYNGKSHKTAYQHRVEATGRFKCFANKLKVE